MPSDAGFEAIIGGDISINGTVEEPSFGGSVNVREGRIDLLPTGEVISDIQIEGTLENRQLSIHHLTATNDTNGRISGNGLVGMTEENAFRWEALLDCANIKFVSLDYATVIADATVKLVGDLSSITISGSATAKKALIDLAARFPSNIPEIKVRYLDETTQQDSSYHVFFDLSIDASHNLEIKGRGLSSQWDGHLHLGGEASDLNVEGLLRCLQGSFTLSTKELTISEGSIVCSGNVFKDSRLNVIANIGLPSITAQVFLKGSLEKPKIAIQSTPPKPDNEILSLLLFNKEFGDISPLQSLQLANTAMTLQRSSGPFDLLDRVKETFGIDIIDFGSSAPCVTPSSSTPLSLDPTDTGPPPQDVQSDVSLKVGKYISDDVAVTVSKNVTSDANYLGLEAQIAPEIIAGAEVGDDQEGIVSLKWKKNY
jgi:translocation and assembly module TamB